MTAAVVTLQQRGLIGREIAGRIRILAKLGEGGMGAVYRGEQLSLKRPVAVKVLRPELSANPHLQRRFETEALAIAKLQHPNIVQVFDFGRDSDGSLFIAMEVVDGPSLRTVLGAEAPLHPARALHIAQQVAASLIEAHSHGIVHGDLKPDNVMLQHRGRRRDVARVLDFGIAKLRDESRPAEATMVESPDLLGTPQYMAPEQIRGDALDGRCDVYALGCLIYEMVTGRQPFEATSVIAILSKHLVEQPIPPSQVRPELGLPPAIDHLVLAAMAKDPAQRPTMEHFADLLARVMQTPAPRPSPAPQPYVHRKRRSVLPLALVLGALACIGAGAWVATREPSTTTDLRTYYQANLRAPAPTPVAAGPAPAPARPKQPHAYTCDQVADRALSLVAKYTAEKLTVEQRRQLAGVYQEESRLLHAKIVQECTAKDWSDARRACVMNATSVAETCE